MTARGPVRAAIVGAGLMGRWHAGAVKHSGGVVAAVVDADSTRALKLAGEFGARPVQTLRQAADSAGPIEVAHICTPLDTHDALAREALSMGLHALVEKPLVRSAAATEALLREADGRGLVVCPVHQFPFQRGVRDVIDALPRLGRVLHVDAVACSAGATAGGDARRDQVAADILPHPLSLFAAVLSSSLASVDWQVARPVPGELRASAVAAGVTVSLLVSMSGRPTVNTLRVIGAEGTAYVDLYHGFSVIESGEVSRARKIAHPFTQAASTLVAAGDNLARRALAGESAYPGLRELVAAFHAAARGEASPPVARAVVLDLARARDAILARAGLA